MNSLFKKIINFLKDVKLEMKKVDWPTRRNAIKYTLIVVGVSLGVAIFLGSCDAVLNKTLDSLL
ncbi:MAG: preprotein translocase subunit SecE [Patescibacteria group bacterium]|nr:preprotein translocase subunit SecE [Patescibacteria group bacterium]